MFITQRTSLFLGLLWPKSKTIHLQCVVAWKKLLIAGQDMSMLDVTTLQVNTEEVKGKKYAQCGRYQLD